MAHKVTFLLLVIGGLNWLLFALTGWEIGKFIGGMDGMVAKVVYILVGLSAAYELAMHKKNCACCNKAVCGPKAGMPS